MCSTVSCAFDVKVAKTRRADIHTLLALINERAWLGHFALAPDDEVVTFRHAQLVGAARAGDGGAWESLIEIALGECERCFFRPLQFVLWGRQVAAAGDARGDAGDAGRSMSGRVLLVGAGKMGAALLAGWLGRGARAADIRVVEPAAEAREGAAAMGVGAVAAPDELAPGFAPEVVLFAVKPQSMDPRRPGLCRFQGTRLLPVDRRRQADPLLRVRPRPPTPRSCAPCPTPRPPWAAA